MDNVELAILLGKYRDSLSVGIEEVIAKLPESEKTQSTNIFGYTQNVYPILSPIFSVLNTLIGDIDLLIQSSVSE